MLPARSVAHGRHRPRACGHPFVAGGSTSQHPRRRSSCRTRRGRGRAPLLRRIHGPRGTCHSPWPRRLSRPRTSPSLERRAGRSAAPPAPRARSATRREQYQPPLYRADVVAIERPSRYWLRRAYLRCGRWTSPVKAKRIRAADGAPRTRPPGADCGRPASPGSSGRSCGLPVSAHAGSASSSPH
jgi:hypothetical protein